MNNTNRAKAEEPQKSDPAAPDRETILKDNWADIGRDQLEQEMEEYNSVSPILSANDIDADWEEAEDSGFKAVGGHVATPDQDIVDHIGRAVGMEFQDNQELRTHDEVLAKRDRHRWELDYRSSKNDPAQRGKEE